MGAADRGVRGLAADRGRPRPVRAGEDHQRPAGAALGRLRHRPGLRARPDRRRDPPFVDLDGDYYQLVGDFDKRFPEGAPSLRKAAVADRRGRLDVRPRRRGSSATCRSARSSAQRVAADTVRHRCLSRAADPGRHTVDAAPGPDPGATCEPLPAFPQPPDGGPRPGRAPRTSSAEVALPSFDNSAMDGYAVVAAGRRLRVGEVARAPARGRRDRRRPAPAARAGARHRGQDHDRRARCRPAPTAVVPYEWTDRGVAQVRIDPAPQPGQHIRPAPARTSPSATCWSSERGTVLGPRHMGLLASIGRATRPLAAAARRGDLRPGPSCASPAHALGLRLDLRRQLRSCWPRPRAAPARSPTASASSRTSRRRSSTRCEDQLVRADIVVTTRRRLAGRLRRGQGGAGAARDVWFGPVAMQPGKPQGFGFVGEDRTPIFTLPGNPVSSYISFRAVRAACPAQADGHVPRTSRPTVRARLDPRDHRRRRAGGSSCGRSTSSTAPPPVSPVGGHGSHLIGDLASSNALVVGPRGHDLARGR